MLVLAVRSIAATCGCRFFQRLAAAVFSVARYRPGAFASSAKASVTTCPPRRGAETKEIPDAFVGPA